MAEDVDKSVVESCPRLRFPNEELVADGGGMQLLGSATVYTVHDTRQVMQNIADGAKMRDEGCYGISQWG